MSRSVGAVVLGLVVAFLLISMIEVAGTLVFAFPPDVDPMDAEAMSAAIEAGRVPVGSMLTVIAAYAAGSFAGGWLTAWLAQRWQRPAPMKLALTLGGILTLMGIWNLVTITHPLWMQIATIVAFVPLAYLGARVAMRAASGG